MALQTLDEFNNMRREHYQELRVLQEPHPNGIACPKCGEGLWDSDPRSVLASNPPQKAVHCPSCDYTGYRLL